MSSTRRNDQILDAEKLDKSVAGTLRRLRRIVRKRSRELRVKGYGISFNFNQKDEEGSEEI